MKTNFNEIKFNPAYHTYTLNGQRLRNVTSLVNKYKPPFDRDYWAAKKAQEQGITAAEIIKQWEDKGQASRNLGTRVHEYIESFLSDDAPEYDPILALNEPTPEIDIFGKFWNTASHSLSPYRLEWRVGDSDLNLAGTIDCVMYSSQTEQYHLFDWKTGSLDTKSDYGNKMLEPLSFMDDCKLNHYSLQLSAYRLIVERNSDINLGRSYMVHLEPHKWTIHLARDFRNYITELL